MVHLRWQVPRACHQRRAIGDLAALVEVEGGIFLAQNLLGALLVVEPAAPIGPVAENAAVSSSEEPEPAPAPAVKSNPSNTEIKRFM